MNIRTLSSCRPRRVKKVDGKVERGEVAEKRSGGEKVRERDFMSENKENLRFPLAKGKLRNKKIEEE